MNASLEYCFEILIVPLVTLKTEILFQERPSFLELLTNDQGVLPSSTMRLSLQDELWQSRRQSDVRQVEETPDKEKKG